MFTPVTRRTILHSALGCASLVALSGCRESTNKIVTKTKVPNIDTVDVHCHVFNASDLSVGGFAKRVVQERYEDEFCFKSPDRTEVLDGIAVLLLLTLRRAAITASDETKALKTGNSNILLTNSRERKVVDTEIMRSAIAEMFLAAKEKQRIVGGHASNNGKRSNNRFCLAVSRRAIFRHG